MGNPEIKRDLLGGVGVCGRIIVEWILKKATGRAWT
jgi:hypothetical protein